jgi:hypothetical protein
VAEEANGKHVAIEVIDKSAAAGKKQAGLPVL